MVELLTLELHRVIEPYALGEIKIRSERDAQSRGRSVFVDFRDTANNHRTIMFPWSDNNCLMPERWQLAEGRRLIENIKKELVDDSSETDVNGGRA